MAGGMLDVRFWDKEGGMRGEEIVVGGRARDPYRYDVGHIYILRIAFRCRRRRRRRSHCLVETRLDGDRACGDFDVRRAGMLAIGEVGGSEGSLGWLRWLFRHDSCYAMGDKV